MRLLQEVGELRREQARDAAVEELARRPYADAEPHPLLSLLGRLLRAIGRLVADAADAAPAGPLGLLLITGLLALLVAAVVVRVRPGGGGRAGSPLFDANRERTAAEHRERAEAAAGQGRFADAVRERLRAVVRELESRGVLDARPGRTADEVAREAGRALPEVADDLARAARVFDEVWYGGRKADAAGYALLVALDRRLTGGRLVAR